MKTKLIIALTVISGLSFSAYTAYLQMQVNQLKASQMALVNVLGGVGILEQNPDTKEISVNRVVRFKDIPTNQSTSLHEE